MAKITLPVSSVVHVDVELSPIASALRNFGAALILGASDVIDPVERIREYSAEELSAIANQFGADAPEYKAAQAFFAQSPRPRSVHIGRWVKVATTAFLRGKILSTPSHEKFRGMSSAGFTLKINGSNVELDGLDFSEVTNLNGVASIVTDGLNNRGKCVWTGSRFELHSNVYGSTSSIGDCTATELSDAMGLHGATVIAGYDSESIQTAVNFMLNNANWYSLFIADTGLSNEEVMDVAGAIEAASPARVVAFTLSDTNELDEKAETIGAMLHAARFSRTIPVYSTTTPYAAVSVLGRMSTVNFEGSNTTITLKFKQCPSVIAERVDIDQYKALRAKCINVFAEFNNDSAILQEGTMANGAFIDEIHGLDWLQNRVETDLWNLLYTTTTKNGQDDTDSNRFLTTANLALDKALDNGLLARGGVWGGDEFGALKRGDVLTNGYYTYIEPYAKQSQSRREGRNLPPMHIAVKLRGAVHFVDVSITVNR